MKSFAKAFNHLFLFKPWWAVNIFWPFAWHNCFKMLYHLIIVALYHSTRKVVMIACMSWHLLNDAYPFLRVCSCKSTPLKVWSSPTISLKLYFPSVNAASLIFFSALTVHWMCLLAVIILMSGFCRVSDNMDSWARQSFNRAKCSTKFWVDSFAAKPLNFWRSILLRCLELLAFYTSDNLLKCSCYAEYSFDSALTVR